MRLKNIKSTSTLCLLTLTVLCFCQCSNKDENGLSSFIEQWQGNKIILPEIMTDIMTGDTIDIDSSEFTIFTYIDSVGCTGCKMKLPLWSEFMNSLDTITNAEVNHLVVIHSPDKRNTVLELKKYSYGYPIYLDKSNQIDKTNEFPDDELYRTFLLDKEKRVILVGNPIYNNNLANLYKSVISGEKTFSEDSKSLIKVDNNQLKFGVIGPGDTVCRSLKIKNMGQDTVFIRGIIPSCDCLTIDKHSQYILPQKEIELPLKFRADSVYGSFYRTIHIYYTNFNLPSIIHISGEVSKL